MGWLDGIINLMDVSLSSLWEMVKAREAGVLQSVGSQRVRGDLVIEQPPPAGFITVPLGCIPTLSRVSASELWLLLFLRPEASSPECVLFPALVVA